MKTYERGLPVLTFNNETALAPRIKSAGLSFIIAGGTSRANAQACRNALSVECKVVMLNSDIKGTTTTINKLKEEFGESSEICSIYMDITETSSVRTAANEVLAKFPRIDTLICNAAIAQIPKQEMAFAVDENQFGAQHHGHLLLCGMLFDRIQESQGQLVIIANLGANAD